LILYFSDPEHACKSYLLSFFVISCSRWKTYGSQPKIRPKLHKTEAIIGGHAAVYVAHNPCSVASTPHSTGVSLSSRDAEHGRFAHVLQGPGEP
jgi:hypothetical protein